MRARPLSPLSIMLAVLLAAPAWAQGPSRPASPEGSWLLFKDSDGRTPVAGARIELSLRNGQLVLKAIQAGETVEDTGTWQIKGRTITVQFKDLEQGRRSGPFAVGRDTLVLPFKMLSNDGPGWSMWMTPAALQSFLSKVPARPSGPEPMPALLLRVQKVAEAFDNAGERGAVDRRARAQAKNYRGGEAEALYAQGIALFLKGYYREAWYAYARASVLKPDNAVYLGNLATVLLEIGSARDARTILEWVTRNYPNLDPPFGNLGAACLQLGDLECARAAFTRGRQLAPDSGLYDYGLGRVLERQGRKEQALASYRAAFDKGYAGSGREGAR